MRSIAVRGAAARCLCPLAQSLSLLASGTSARTPVSLGSQPVTRPGFPQTGSRVMIAVLSGAAGQTRQFLCVAFSSAEQRGPDSCPCRPSVPGLLSLRPLPPHLLQQTSSLARSPQPVSTEIIQFYLIISHYFPPLFF